MKREYYTDAMKMIERDYLDIFGEMLDSDRLDELDNLLMDCENLNDLDALADNEDATISYGERDAMERAGNKIYGLTY